MNLPLKFLLQMRAGWVNRAQQDAIDYLLGEHHLRRAVREYFRGKFTVTLSKASAENLFEQFSSSL